MAGRRQELEDPELANSSSLTPTDDDVTIATFPLPQDGQVLVLVEANAHVTQVLSLSPQAARNLVVGLLEAIDIATPGDDGDAWWDRA